MTDYLGPEKSENEEEGEAEDSDSESELLLRETLKKQQYRKRRQSCDSGDGGGKVETVTGEIPVDILKRISPLCGKMFNNGSSFSRVGVISCLLLISGKF